MRKHGFDRDENQTGEQDAPHKEIQDQKGGESCPGPPPWADGPPSITAIEFAAIPAMPGAFPSRNTRLRKAKLKAASSSPNNAGLKNGLACTPANSGIVNAITSKVRAGSFGRRHLDHRPHVVRFVFVFVAKCVEAGAERQRRNVADRARFRASVFA